MFVYHVYMFNSGMSGVAQEWIYLITQFGLSVTAINILVA